MRQVTSLIFCLSIASIARSQWSDVQALPRESHVEIVLAKSRVYGRLASTTDTSIAVRRGPRVTTVLRGDVERVGVRSGKARLRNARNGALIGLGIGVAVPFFIEDSARPEANLILGGFGAAIGFGVGALAPGYRTVYRR